MVDKKRNTNAWRESGNLFFKELESGFIQWKIKLLN